MVALTHAGTFGALCVVSVVVMVIMVLTSREPGCPTWGEVA
jgi:hypothetical protein